MKRVASAIALLLLTLPFTASAQAPPTKLRTKWAADVSPVRVLPEYPRPQMVRANWTNLNGEWQYAVTEKSAARPQSFTGRILVPFAIQSQLSGVAMAVTEQQRLWYRRTFRPAALARGSRLLLHFGAVDWEAHVFVNGKEVGSHTGGYDPFSFDVTDALKPGGGDQELLVSVWDPTDKSTQPRGKQVLQPRSIWYTAVTGIWQTVWMETVPTVHVRALEIGSDAAAGTITVTVRTSLPAVSSAAPAIRIVARDGTRVATTATGYADRPIVLRIADPKLWSPDTPFLYDLRS
jgi:beta-galactosidase/beta-glucuronidase